MMILLDLDGLEAAFVSNVSFIPEVDSTKTVRCKAGLSSTILAKGDRGAAAGLGHLFPHLPLPKCRAQSLVLKCPDLLVAPSGSNGLVVAEE